MIDVAHSLYESGDYSGAESAYLDIVRSDLSDIDAIFGLGKTYQACGRDSDAELCYRRIIAIEPEHAGAHCNLGAALAMGLRYNEAIASLEEAIRIEPRYADAHNNLAFVLHCRNDYAEAEEHARLAVELEPGNSLFRMNYGMALYRRNDERSDAEFRWLMARERSHVFRDDDGRLWDGSPLDGRTILILGEWGLGDSIQYVRYASALKSMGGRVIVECSRSLSGFLETCDGVDAVVSIGDTLPSFDVYAKMHTLYPMSGYIPQTIPYLSADPGRVERWRSRLASQSGFRVGISWHGERKNPMDFIRSFPLSCFDPLASIEGVTLISIQKGYGVDQLRDCSFPVVDFGDEVDPGMRTYLDTPALMKSLDLIITPDTSLAHTAGALGLPIWIAVRSMLPDWRWDMTNDDGKNPWYPTARIFRQTKSGDWTGLFSEMVDALRKLIPSSSSSMS